MATEPSEAEWGRIDGEIFAGRLIQAIKLYREASGEGLKESKDVIEGRAKELRGRSPEKFSAAEGRAGCMGVIVLWVGIGVVAGGAVGVVWG